MKQYKPIVIRISYFTVTDVLTASVDGLVDGGKGQEFNVGWILGME